MDKTVKYHSRIKGKFAEFKLNRNTLNLLLNLRLQGWSYNALSSFFGIDKSSVRYQCERYGIFYIGRGIQLPGLHGDKKVRKWRYEEGEKINIGKSYADYMRELKDRPPSR